MKEPFQPCSDSCTEWLSLIASRYTCTTSEPSSTIPKRCAGWLCKNITLVVLKPKDSKSSTLWTTFNHELVGAWELLRINYRYLFVKNLADWTRMDGEGIQQNPAVQGQNQQNVQPASQDQAAPQPFLVNAREVVTILIDLYTTTWRQV